VGKTFFYIHKNIVTKKLGMGGKTREAIFPETQQKVRTKNGKKIVAKNCDKTFFIITQIS